VKSFSEKLMRIHRVSPAIFDQLDCALPKGVLRPAGTLASRDEWAGWKSAFL